MKRRRRIERQVRALGNDDMQSCRHRYAGPTDRGTRRSSDPGEILATDQRDARQG